MHKTTQPPKKEIGGSNKLDDRTLFCNAPSYVGAAEGLCMLVRHFLRQHELPELAFSTELIVRECLNNAIHHGNRRDPRKRVRLLVAAEKGVVYVTVADEGQGFNWNSYTPARLPSHTEPTGRGLAVISSYARHVTFNRKGNVIKVEIAGKRSRRRQR